jgi:cysteine-rich repeat protein
MNRAYLACALATCVLACTDEDGGSAACRDSTDCDEGQVCAESVCVAADGGPSDLDAGEGGPDDGGPDRDSAGPDDATIEDADTSDPDGAADAGDAAAPECGNGELSGDEACDDGNAQSDDGCAHDCSAVEEGFFCTQEAPSVCTPCGPVYVDASSSAAQPDGLSWPGAHHDLQLALAQARALIAPEKCAVVQVWVADGIYTPAPVGQRAVSFELSGGLELYGGFAGDETSRDARDWVLRRSVLSGDLNRDDLAGGTAAENAYHVVKAELAEQTALLDGFVVEGGFADGAAAPDFHAAGLYLRFGSPRLQNLLVRGNTAAQHGGGLYLEQSEAQLVGVEVQANAATHGAGIYSLESELTLHDCALVDNTATVSEGQGFGAGMYATGSGLDLVDVRFEGNLLTGNSEQSRSGGALYLYGSDVRIDGGLFLQNQVLARTVGTGGAIHSESGTSLVIVRSDFTENEIASQGGYARGGAVMSVAAMLRITSTSFWRNVASTPSGPATGGAVHHELSDASLFNALFGGNQASAGTGQVASGGAVFTADGDATLVNATLRGNRACAGTLCTGAIASPFTTFQNSVLWDNAGGLTGAASIDHSCIQGGNFDETAAGQTNRDDCNPGADGTLPAGSGGIDRGDSAALPEDRDDLDGDGDLDEPLPFDLDGNARVSGAAVDMGAFERP